MDPKNVKIKLKNGHFSMVIFLYNLYIFVWIYKHGCLTDNVYVLDPNNNVITRLWCVLKLKSVYQLFW